MEGVDGRDEPGHDNRWLASARPVAGERDAVHDAPVAVIIVDRIVLRAAIVPQRDRARLPTKAAGEFRARRSLEQINEDGRAFLLGHVPEAPRVTEVHI